MKQSQQLEKKAGAFVGWILATCHRNVGIKIAGRWQVDLPLV